MKKSIKLLLVEDNPNDAKLLMKELGKDFNLTVHKVETENDFIKELNTFSPDIVISDYSLPTFDGMRALKIKLEINPLLPFIISTGSINEEIAVDCIKQGADDYVIKQHISKISLSVKSALEKKSLRDEKEKTFLELKNSELRYKTLFKTAKDGILIIDAEFRKIIDVNPYLLELIGYSYEEIIGEQLWELGFLKDFIQNQESFNDLIKDDYIRYDDLPLRTKNGEIKNVEFVSNVYSVDDIKIIQCNIRDITERKKAIELIAQKSSVMKASMDGMAVLTHDGIFITLNDAHLKIYGYESDSELIGKSWETLYNENELKRFHEEIMPLLLNYKQWSGETIGLRKDGSKFNQELSLNIDDSGEIICIVRDITERKNAEREIIESSIFNQSLLHTIPFGIDIVDQEGNILFLNDKLKLSFGENAIGKKCWELYRDNKIQCSDCPLREEIKIGETSFIDTENVLNGKSLHIDHTGMLFQGKKAMLEVFQDITERKQSENALRENEERFRRIFDESPIGKAISSLDSRFIRTNEAMRKMFGYSEEEFTSLTYKDLTHPDYVEKDIENLKKLVRGEIQQYKTEKQYITKNKEIIWGSVIVSVVRDAKNIPMYYLVIIQDITASKTAEDNLRESEERFRNMFENHTAVMYLVEPGTLRIVDANNAAVKFYGYDRETLKTMTVIDLNVLSEEGVKNEIEKAKKENRDYFHYKHKLANGDIRDVEIRSPLINLKDRKLNFAIINDVTERNKAEEELIIAKEKAEEMSRLKSNFLANMSHELRTPMIGILGYTEILKEESQDEGTKSVADIIHKSSTRLLDTLNLILDLSRIEADKLEIKISEIDVIADIRDTIKLFEETASNKNLYLHFNSKLDSLMLSADESMFRQIINNLINNAIKFTNNGGIDIEVDTEKDKHNEYAVIKVKDTGIGIASEEQSLIWEEFRQASEGRSRNFEGSGLGLTITRKFVEKLKGTISVQSEAGKGSIFTIKLPIHKLSVISVIKENNVSYNTVDRKDIPCILLVEDDPTNSQVIKFFLKNRYNVDIAQTGADSIKMANEKDYSLILMDINLGKDMNGIVAAKEIKKIPGKEKIPIVAVTAFAMTGDKEEFLNEGLDSYIAKPFNKTQIINLIEEVLSKK